METATAAAPSGPLMNRNFSLVWMGQTVSQLGTQAYAVAMMYWVKDSTGSASLMGLLMAASTLPGVFLGPFGGTFADRHSRIGIIIKSDLLAGLAVGALTLALWLRPDATRFIVGLLFVVGVLLGAIRSFFGPAYAAVIPDLVPKERLAAANSLTQLSFQAATIIGPAVGVALYGALGAPLLFLTDSLSYFFSAAAAVPIPRDRPQRTETPAGVHPFRQFLHETAEGFRWVWSRKGMRDFLLGVSLINFLAMPVTVLFPFYVELYLHRSPDWYGYLMIAIGLGIAVGFVLAGTLRLKGGARTWGVLAAMVLYPVCFSTLAFLRQPSLAAVAVFFGGMTVGIINVYLITLIQAATPTEVRGRVMGLLGTLSGGLIPLGMALGGVVGDLTGKNVPLILLVTAGLALCVSLFLIASRHCREFLATD
jgi:MFS transporter, DHA3 family, macrolide efflux protein